MHLSSAAREAKIWVNQKRPITQSTFGLCGKGELHLKIYPQTLLPELSLLHRTFTLPAFSLLPTCTRCSGASAALAAALHSCPAGTEVEGAMTGSSCIFPNLEQETLPAARPPALPALQPSRSTTGHGVFPMWNKLVARKWPDSPPPRWFFGPAFAYLWVFLPLFSLVSFSFSFSLSLYSLVSCYSSLHLLFHNKEVEIMRVACCHRAQTLHLFCCCCFVLH